MKQNKKHLTTIIAIIAITIFSWLVLFPYRGLPFLGKYGIILGKNPTIHILMIAVAFLYFYLFVNKPETAKKTALNSITTVKDLLIYVIAALFIAGAATNLYPTESLAGILGNQAGITALIIGILIGAVLPACPFISYPIIGGLYTAGAGFLGIIGMLFGSGLGFACVI